MTIKLVSCMNVSFCSDVDHHGLLYEFKLLMSIIMTIRLVSCLHVSFSNDGHKVGLLYEC